MARLSRVVAIDSLAEAKGWRRTIVIMETQEMICPECDRWRVCYHVRDRVPFWICKQCAGPLVRAWIKGWMAPDLTPAMENALREWVDRVGATGGYHFSHDVFSEHNNRATAWRKSCGRLAVAGYLEPDEAWIAANGAHFIPPYRVTDKGLSVLGICHSTICTTGAL